MILEYECFYAGRRWSCVAEDAEAAHAMAVAHFQPQKSKRHMVFVLTKATTRRWAREKSDVHHDN
jgi:hypothetical protein